MKSKLIDIDGVPVAVLSDEDAEKVDYMVCMPADVESAFDDNLTGFCCMCGIKVMFRWHAPRNPQRICINCFCQDKGKSNETTV